MGSDGSTLVGKEEVLVKLLPCPKCGCAPAAAGNNKIKCGNEDCMFAESGLYVESWNNEIRTFAVTLKREAQRTKPPKRAPEVVEKMPIEVPNCKVVEAIDKDPEANIEWLLRVQSINLEEEED